VLIWYIETDNIIKVDGLRSAETGVFVNDATVTGILYKLPALNPNAGAAASNIGSGLCGITCTVHGLSVGDTIRIENTINYDGEYVLQSGTTINLLVFTATYVAETFTGEEFIYEAIAGTVTVPIPFNYVTASDGDYVGKIPRTTAFFQDARYVICIKEVSGLEQVLAKVIDVAGFLGI